MIATFIGLLDRCHHRQDYSQSFAIFYCLVSACIYVGSLYALVPRGVRKLERDHPRHIQWRISASLIVSAVAIMTYPLFFCEDSSRNQSSTRKFSISELIFFPRKILGILGHTLILYIGPIVAGLVRVYEIRKQSPARGDQTDSYPYEVYRRLLRPTIISFFELQSPEDRWKIIRNLVVAPWTEEVVFRGCMVPALLGTGMSPLRVAWISPLFFGVAHVHHAITRLSKRERLQPVLLRAIFQFLYTSLFGAYAAHALIRTGSVTAVTMSHAYCNWMGLPDFGFVQSRHPLHPYRLVLATTYLVGILGFAWLFTSDLMLPIPARLPTFVSDTAQ